MRWLGVVLCVLAAGCGRIAFDPRFDGGGGDSDDGGGDAGFQLAYLKASNTDPGDSFGASVAVSADGMTIAVGAPLESSDNGTPQTDNSAREAGAVYIFRRTGDLWAQEAFVKPLALDMGDQFGWSVGLSGDGNLLVVGARHEDSANANLPGDNNAMSSGAAYVFSRTGSSWSQAAYIKAPTIDSGDGFGERVAISGDGSTIAIGTFDEDSATNSINGDETDNSAPSAGAVWVFAGPAWVPEAYLKAPNADAGDAFGFSVALSGDGNMLAVGAYQEDNSTTGVGAPLTNDGAPEAGIAYVFARNGIMWTLDIAIKASNTDAGDNFGYAVGLAPDASTLVVTAEGESSQNGPSDNLLPSSGGAYLFKSQPTWAQKALTKATAADADDELGYCADVSNVETLVTGAPFEDGSGPGQTGSPDDNSVSDAGALYLFSVASPLAPPRYLKAPNPGADDHFGFACAMASNGATVVVGAPEENGSGIGVDPPHDDLADNAGAVYVFY